MPHYDYRCEKCGNTFEVFQSMTEEPLKICPACKGSVRRLISGGVGIIFKGSGFYKTDYAKKSTTPACDKKNDSLKCESCPAGSPKTDSPIK